MARLGIFFLLTLLGALFVVIELNAAKLGFGPTVKHSITDVLPSFRASQRKLAQAGSSSDVQAEPQLLMLQPEASMQVAGPESIGAPEQLELPGLQSQAEMPPPECFGQPQQDSTVSPVPEEFGQPRQSD